MSLVKSGADMANNVSAVLMHAAKSVAKNKPAMSEFVR
jgi:hypothetical protein